MLKVVLVFAHEAKNSAQHGNVILLTVCTDEVGLTNFPGFKDAQHRRRMIGCVNPVAHVQALAVELRGQPREDIRNLPGNKFFDVLIRPVVIRAVRDGRLNPERTHPGAHQQIGACLGGGVRGGGVVGS